MMFFLGEGFRVIAHDRRGHGRSSQTDSGNEMDTYAADVAELVDQLDLAGRDPYRPFDRRRRSRPAMSRAPKPGRVAKAVLIGAVPPVMVKKDRTPAACRSKCSTGCARARSPTARSSTSICRAGLSTASTGPARRSSQGDIDNWWRQGDDGRRQGAATTASRPSPRPTSPRI